MQPADYARALRRGAALVVLTGLLGLGLAGLRVASAVPQYEGSSTLLFSVSRAGTVNELSQGTTYAQGLAQTYAEVARQPIVLEPVVQRLGLALTPEQLARRVRAEAALDTPLLEVRVRDGDPERAAAIANAVTTGVVAAAERLAPEAPLPGPGAGPGAAERPNLEVRSVAPASPPTFPVSPRPARDLALGLVAGLALGVLLALVRAARYETVQDESDAVAAGLPLLGTLPRDRAAAGPPRSGGDWAGAVLGLRTVLVSGTALPAARTLLITSPRSRDGRSTVATHLAASLADGGLPTLLVDADLRTAGTTRLLDLEDAPGLGEVLEQPGQALTLLSAPYGERHPLRVLPAGRAGPDPVAALSGPALPRVLEELAGGFAVVVVDGPPLLPAPESGVLVQACDSVLVVARSGRTRRRDLSGAVQRLERLGRPPLGLVLDGVRRRRASGARPGRPSDRAAADPVDAVG